MEEFRAHIDEARKEKSSITSDVVFEALLKRADVDANGVIDFNEWVLMRMERGGGGGAARGNTANALEVSGMEFGGGGGGGDYGSLFLLEGPKQVGASGATPLQLTYGGGGGGGGVSSVWASGQSSIVGGPARARIPLVLEETPRGPTPTASERGREGVMVVVVEVEGSTMAEEEAAALRR